MPVGLEGGWDPWPDDIFDVLKDKGVIVDRVQDKPYRGFIVASEGPRESDIKPRTAGAERLIPPGLRLFDADRVPIIAREDAEKRARELAQQNPNATFYVLKVVSYTFTEKPITTVTLEV